MKSIHGSEGYIQLRALPWWISCRLRQAGTTTKLCIDPLTVVPGSSIQSRQKRGCNANIWQNWHFSFFCFL